MVDLAEQFEFKDSLGVSTPYTGSVGTSAINVPTSAGNNITEMFVRCPNQTPITRQLLYSVDGGTTFLTLNTGEFIMWPLKGSIKQIQVKGSVASVNYEVILNTDQSGEL